MRVEVYTKDKNTLGKISRSETYFVGGGGGRHHTVVKTADRKIAGR